MPNYSGPHDYFNESYVNEWSSVANSKRPFRLELFDAFVSELAELNQPRVLDLGSGPGFLAERVLGECNVASYCLFDFSPYMLELSKTRLRNSDDRAVFQQGSFLEEGWWKTLPAPFDAIVSIQAVHEVRDSRRIPRLYDESFQLLREGSVILIADEVNDLDKSEPHLLSLPEHEEALLEAGFEAFRMIWSAGDLVLFGARVK